MLSQLASSLDELAQLKAQTQQMKQETASRLAKDAQELKRASKQASKQLEQLNQGAKEQRSVLKRYERQQENSWLDFAIKLSENSEKKIQEYCQEQQANHQSMINYLPENHPGIAESAQLMQENIQRITELVKSKVIDCIEKTLPKDCPKTLEGLREYKAQRELKEQQKIESKQQKQEQLRVLEEQELVRQEQNKLEKNRIRDAQVKRSQKENQMLRKVATHYKPWQMILGGVVGVGVCMLVAPSMNLLYLICAGSGALAGYLYRNSVIKAGKKYLVKEDVQQIQDIDKLKAFQLGIEAKAWKGYFVSFYKDVATYKHRDEFKAGMIQSITDNKEVVDAVRLRRS